VRHSDEAVALASELPVQSGRVVSKPLSHSLRLFGNMYAGEILPCCSGVLARTALQEQQIEDLTCIHVAKQP